MSLKSLVSDGLRNFTLGRHVHITSPQLACVSTWSGESKTELLKHRSTGRPKPRRSKSFYEGRNIEVDQGDLQLEVVLTIRVDGKKTQNKKTHTQKKTYHQSQHDLLVENWWCARRMIPVLGWVNWFMDTKVARCPWRKIKVTRFL